jgi:phenylacetate-CoA ligase
MARFDGWVTDPSVTRLAEEPFVADLDNLGSLTTTDNRADYAASMRHNPHSCQGLVVSTELPRPVRGLYRLRIDRRAGSACPGAPRSRRDDLPEQRVCSRRRHGWTAGPCTGQAAVFANGGHFLSTTMFERRLRMAPFRRRIARFYSVLDPLPKLVVVPAQLSRDVRECLRH